MSEPKYQPKKGTEDFVHVVFSEKNGQPVDNPEPEYFRPAYWEQVKKLAGFKGEVVHDPRTAAEKHEEAPAPTTVRSENLSTAAQYRARYTELFRHEPPAILTEERITEIVDRAEKQLAEPFDKPATSEAGSGDAPATGEGEGADSGTDKLPTDKTGWYELYKQHQQEAQAEVKAYEEITVAAIREVLGK